MKLLKTAEGKTKLSMTRAEWEIIGGERGWIKEAKWDKPTEVSPKEKGKWTNYTKEELIKKRDAAKARQEKRDKADPKDTEILRELNFAIRAKGDWGKAAEVKGNKTVEAQNNEPRRSRMIEPDTGQLIEGIDMSIFDQTKLDKAKEWLEKNYPNIKWTLEKVKDWINKNFIGKAKPVSESNPIKDLYHGDHVRR